MIGSIKEALERNGPQETLIDGCRIDRKAVANPFQEIYCQNIGAESEASREELEPYFAELFPSVKESLSLSMAVFNAALNETSIGKLLSDADRLIIHDIAIEHLKKTNGLGEACFEQLIDEIYGSESLYDVFLGIAEREALADLVEYHEKDLLKILDKYGGDTFSVADKAEAFLVDIGAITEGYIESQDIMVILKSIDDRKGVLDILSKYFELPDSDETDSKVHEVIERELEALMKTFRMQAVKCIDELIFKDKQVEDIPQELFVANCNVAAFGDQVVACWEEADPKALSAYRAESVATILLQKYSIGTSEVYCSRPYSKADRPLHTDIMVDGKSYDVKSSPSAFVIGLAKQLGFTSEEVCKIDNLLQEFGIELKTSKGSPVKIFDLVNQNNSRNPAIVGATQLFTQLNELKQDSIFVYGDNDGLRTFKYPDLILVIPSDPFTSIKHLEAMMDVTIDPMSNEVGRVQLEKLKEDLFPHLNDPRNRRLHVLARKVYAEFALMESDPEKYGKSAGLAILKHCYEIGSQKFKFSDTKRLSDLTELAGGSVDILVGRHPTDSKDSLSRGFTPSLVSIWEDLGVVTFDSNNQRMMIKGLPGSLSKSAKNKIEDLVDLATGGQLTAELEKLDSRLVDSYKQLIDYLGKIDKDKIVNNTADILEKLSPLLKEVAAGCGLDVENYSADNKVLVPKLDLIYRADLIKQCNECVVDMIETLGIATAASNGSFIKWSVEGGTTKKPILKPPITKRQREKPVLKRLNGSGDTSGRR